jgi:hypothetical protein
MSMQPDKIDPMEVKALDEYAIHQQELGLPMFPASEAKARVEKEGYRSIFTDVKKVDEWEPSMKQIAANSADPDNVRQMFANSMFLSTELGVGKDEVMSKYQEYLSAYSQKVWGMPVSDTAGFYGMAQGHVRKQVEADEVSGEAMRLALTSAALGTNDSIGDYQKWREKTAGKAPTEDAHWTFSVTYGKVKSQIEDKKQIVSGAVSALKQMMSGEGATAGTDTRIVDAIVDMDPKDRPLVLAAIMAGAQATGEAADKNWTTFFPQVGEAFSRILTSAWGGVGRQELEQNLITVKAEYLGGKDGKMLLPESPVTSPEQARDLVEKTLLEVIGKKTSFVQMGTGSSTGMGGGPVPVPPIGEEGTKRYRTPTEQERRLINSELNRVTRTNQITREIENAAVATDPVKALFANSIGSTFALVPAAMMGPGGVMVAAKAYSGMEYDKIRLMYPTIPEEKVSMISDLSGFVMAGLDKIEGDFLTGKLPSVSHIIKKGIFSTVVGRMGLRAVEGVAVQNLQEGFQDASRLVVQDLAAAVDSDIEGTDLSEWSGFWDERLDVAIDMIPLNIIGLGAGTYNDFANSTELMKRRDLLNLAGINDEAATPIIDLANNGDVEGSQAALREAFLNRDPEIARAASERMGPAAQAMQRFDTLLTQNSTPRYTQEGDNHILTFPDGRVIKAESWAEARFYMEQAMGDKLSEEITVVADMANFFTSQKREGVTESVDMIPEKRTQQQETEADTITEEQARERAAIAGEAYGLTPEEAQEEVWTVLGRNTVDTQGEVAKSTIDLFEGAGVDTVVEEVVEGRLKVALHKKRYSMDEVKGFIAQVESVTNEKFLVTDTEQGVIEAISAIVVADVIGRRKDGTQLPAGLVTRGMLQAVQRQSTPQANRKLMGMVQAFRSFFRQVFSRARALNKAKAEGKLGKEYQGFVDELLGVDPQVRELNVAATEARAMVTEVTGGAQTQEVAPKKASQVGLGVVRYAGVTGRLERLGERYVIKPKAGPEVELSGEDFVDVVFETDPATLAEFAQPASAETDGRTGAPTVEPTTGFTPARDGTLSITTPDGRTLVPVKRELAKNIVRNRRGTGFKLKDVNDKYGDRAVTLYGEEATQAIDAMLEAAANVEGMGRKVSYSLGRAAPKLDRVEGTVAEFLDLETKQTIKFGEPVTFNYARNNTPAVKAGKTFGQDIEPAGRFLSPVSQGAVGGVESLEYGTVTFQQPLVLEWVGYGEDGWKARLSKAFGGKKGASLSKAIAAEGYDGIITVSQTKGGLYATETVDLSMWAKPQTTYSLGRATPQDREYLAAVERGDMETAQRMVDEAAQRAGYSAEGFHGTHRDFTVFNRLFALKDRIGLKLDTVGSWFTDSSNVAKLLYGPKVMRSYLSLRKPLVFDGIGGLQNFRDEVSEAHGDVETFRKWAKSKGYDGVEISGDFVDGELQTIRIVFDPNQIKSADPVTRDDQGNVIPPSQRFNPQDNRITYALAPAKFSEQVMTELEKELGKDPAQRWAMAMEIVRRISKLRTDVDAMAAADLTATQRKEQKEQFVREKFDELVAQMPPNQSVEELEKVMAQAKKEGEEWAAQNKADAPGQRDRIIGYQRIVNAALMGLPKKLRTDIGGFLQVADARSATTALKAIKNHIGKIGDTVERYLKEEFQTEIKALIKRGKPNLKAGEAPSSNIGAEASNLFGVAAEAIKMNEVQTLKAISDRETEILDPNNKPTPEREQQLRDEINIINLAGDLKNATAAESKALLDTLQEIYDGGYLIRLARENQKRAVVERLKDMFKVGTGLKTPQEVEAAMAKMRARGKGALWWDTILLELGSFNDLIYMLAGENSEFARELLNMERKSDNMVHDLNDAMEKDVGDFFTRIAGSEIKGQHLRAAMSLNTKKGKLWLGVNKAGQPPVKHVIKIAGQPDAVEYTSQMEAIHDLMMWRQPDGKRNMGGKYDLNGQRTSTWGYDDAWAQETMNQLTPESWQLMDWLTQQYKDEYAVIDPLVRDRLGVMLPQNPLYSPLTNSPAQVQAGQMTNPVTGAAVNGSMGITSPALKTRNTSINKPRKGDALKVFMAHSRQMNHWIANYDFARTMQQLFLSRDMLDYVEAKGGEAAVRMLLTRVDMAVLGGMRDSGVQLAIDGALKDAAGRAAASAILGRVSTLAVQSTQLFAASMQMPQSTFLRLFGKLSAGQLDWSGTKNSQFIQRRIAQKSPLVQEAMRGLLNATSPSLIKNQQRRLAELLAGTDAYFTAATHTMIYHHQLEVAKGLGMTGAEAKQFAMDEADRLTEEVAQPVRQSQRSLLELRNSQTWGGRVGWAFASEARQKLAILMVAADKVKTDPSWNNIGELARVANYVFMINGLLVQMWKRSWLLARTPGGDDEDYDWKGIVLSSLASPLTGAPGWQVVTDTGNMLSAGMRSEGAINRMVATIAGEDQPYDGDPVKFMKDAELILGALSLFSDTAATLSGYSHIATDLAKLIDAQTED